MFEVAELKSRLDKTSYAAQVPDLRMQLLDLQQMIEPAGIPVVFLVAGLDCAGKGDIIHTLNEWMDPRYMETHAFGRPSEDERERPNHWRYWMAQPRRGRIGIFSVGWYGPPLADRLYSRIDEAVFLAELAHINRLEKAWTNDGAVVVKCWLHLSKKQQRKIIEKTENDPETRWKITETEHEHLKLYDEFLVIAEKALRATNTPEAPWFLVNGYDSHYRRIAVGRHLAQRITARLEGVREQRVKPEPPVSSPGPSILGTVDLKVKLGKKAYRDEKTAFQSKISRLTRLARQQKRSAMLVFEGWDAAGKGGVIRRITPAMDARNYRVIPIQAPSDEERAHHYLWRFWRHLPRDGNVTIYDRSWYGRVLVERVEGFASDEEWHRAYSEINDFEEELTGHGIILLKFWLHISKDEQARRFREREQTRYKRYKITAEDLRNREKWDAYEQAVNDMVTQTSTTYAPWHLIAANDKYHARVEVFRTLCKAYQRALNY
ncbi:MULTISPECIES: polyphosphate:AMP phosphotransferase [Methylococcus]|uniref:Polyphosphate:AMP phosphotransferase n=1 Tax=Methylococcus capsulatus TaxID=414 RepID=A0ABZ2F7E9_METCP|nr:MULTISPECIES: polyphosphate:AMP phosphotransferase [Methylococcus]MDF9393216.1 polyphosphate:AMP phosphotransferase [Methylococcus capsulatus]